MNTSHLRTLVEVVEHGSFSAAARVLGVSQPAVTMQLQALEAELGVTLLDRKYRKVELTEAGRALLPHARRILHDMQTVRSEIEGLSDVVSGRLLLSASTTPGQYVLPRLLGGFLARNPRVSVALSVGDTGEVLDAIESGAAHLGMTGAVVRGRKVHFEELGTDDLVMICAPGHPFASATGLKLARAVEAPFIMRETGSGTRLVTENVLRTAGVDPGDLNVVTELGTGEAIVNAVEGGMGVSVVSAWVADKALRLGSVSLVPVAEFPVSRPLFAVSPRTTLTHAAAAFLEYLRDGLGAAAQERSG